MTKATKHRTNDPAICINCGQIVYCSNRPPTNLGMCSAECGEQWKALVATLDEVTVTPEIGHAFVALYDFGINWPKITAKEFQHLAEISEQMNAKHPDLWPFKIETSGDCWLYQRKDAVVEHVH